MGLDVYLEWAGQTEEEKQARYTGYRTDGSVGYLRSAYNSSGFNSWCGRFMPPEFSGGYYSVFAYSEDAEQPITDPSTGKIVYPEGEDLEDQELKEGEHPEPRMGFFPDWPNCARRVKEMQKIAAQIDHLYTVSVSLFPQHAL